jgi:bacteriophage N4 adsorption protein A
VDFKAALNGDDLPLQTEIGILLELDRKQEATERFKLALSQGGIAGQSDADMGYLATRVENDPAAFTAFERAANSNTLPDGARRDAAFAAIRVARNDQAVAFFKQALDAADANRLKLTPKEAFDTRRAVAELSRSWGTFASLSYRGITAPGLGTTQANGANDSLQAGVETYWRPFGYRNGRLFEVYGRVSETLSGGEGVRTGSESLQGVVGARLKPFGETNLVLSLERLFPLGSQVNHDWLARIGYSSSNGTDLRVDTPSWLTSQVYAEVGHYMQHTQNYFTSEVQMGRSFRLDAIEPKLVLFPHAVLGADYNSTLSNDKNAVGAGAGINLRYWFNEDRYRAPSSNLDLSLQYRARIAGDARAKGLFLRMTVSY